MFQERDTIEFDNRQYKCRIVYLGKEFGKLQIGTTELEKKLVTEEGGYTSEEARFVDEEIFYFVYPWKFRLSNKALAKDILSNL